MRHASAEQRVWCVDPRVPLRTTLSAGRPTIVALRPGDTLAESFEKKLLKVTREENDTLLLAVALSSYQ